MIDELPGLLKAVLARGRIDDKQDLVRRVGYFPGGDSAHLAQFRHQIGLGVQAARRVHDHQIGLPVFGRGERVEEHGRRVRSGLLLDHLDAQAACPDLQLLVGGGAKSVRGAKDWMAILLQVVLR